jgi:hypothetical protein
LADQPTQPSGPLPPVNQTPARIEADANVHFVTVLNLDVGTAMPSASRTLIHLSTTVVVAALANEGRCGGDDQRGAERDQHDCAARCVEHERSWQRVWCKGEARHSRQVPSEPRSCAASPLCLRSAVPKRQGMSMAHVTFIHGTSNKPPADELAALWRGTLADHGLDLNARGVTSTMVYWADLLYPVPLSAQDPYESVEAADAIGVSDLGMLSLADLQGEEAVFVKQLAATIGYEELSASDPTVPAAVAPEAEGLERVPLPWQVKRQLMKVFLRDVHHYLFDAEFGPRPGGERVRIRRTIRERTVAALRAAAIHEGPQVVVGHSLGSVIAYDCLKRVEGCPAVDALMTVGSPLGIDEVQDRLRPQWSRTDGFPSERVRGRWVNVFDRLDPVAADGLLANDFRCGGVSAVEDIEEPNWGAWRHSITRYLAGERLRQQLRRMLDGN